MIGPGGAVPIEKTSGKEDPSGEMQTNTEEQIQDGKGDISTK